MPRAKDCLFSSATVELTRGQRWNLRDTFSLGPELLVGQWSDFDSSVHPCESVHGKHAAAAAAPPDADGVLTSQ